MKVYRFNYLFLLLLKLFSHFKNIGTFASLGLFKFLLDDIGIILFSLFKIVLDRLLGLHFFKFLLNRIALLLDFC